MVDLDDPALLTRQDPGAMAARIAELPESIVKAWQAASEFDLPDEIRSVKSVVITGMGGSAIGGDLLRTVMEAYGSVPLLVNRDYDLPAFVGPETLVLAASYSGDTEETLSAYKQARGRKAQIVCITSGGELADRAKADKVPEIEIPGGQPPRTATGFMFFPMLAVLAQRGLLNRDVAADTRAALALLDCLRAQYGPESPSGQNPAKQLAIALHARIPVIYGTQGYRGVIAVRWKGQFNDLRTRCLHLLLRIYRRVTLRENSRFYLTKSLNHAGTACLARPKYQPDERADAREDECRAHPRIPERSEANTTEHAHDG